MSASAERFNVSRNVDITYQVEVEAAVGVHLLLAVALSGGSHPSSTTTCNKVNTENINYSTY